MKQEKMKFEDIKVSEDRDGNSVWNFQDVLNYLGLTCKEAISVVRSTDLCYRTMPYGLYPTLPHGEAYITRRTLDALFDLADNKKEITKVEKTIKVIPEKKIKEEVVTALVRGQSDEAVKKYFLKVLELKKSGNEFPVNLNEIWPLVYSEKGKAVRALKEAFIENVDYQSLTQNGKREIGATRVTHYFLSVSCMEYFIVRKVRHVFEVYRQVFHKVAESVPALPVTYIEALEKLLATEKEKLALESSLKEKEEVIEEKVKTIAQKDFKIAVDAPKVDYYEEVLQSEKLFAVNTIAAEFDMTAKELNKRLEADKIQHKNGQGVWILHKKYMGKGYTGTKTYSYEKDGKILTTMHTYWTEKGRKFLHELYNKES